MPCKCTEHDHVPSASNEAVHYHAKSERSTLGMLMPPIVRVWTLFSFFPKSSLLFFYKTLTAEAGQRISTCCSRNGQYYRVCTQENFTARRCWPAIM